jgi:hypothetical protein
VAAKRSEDGCSDAVVAVAAERGDAVKEGRYHHRARAPAACVAACMDPCPALGARVLRR